MTTNGVGLDRFARPLADAGLDRVNVSLDTVDRAHFERLTRRDRFDDVVAGLKAAADAGLTPVKVNAVAMRGVNETDVVELLQWCLDRGYELRFIEQMPLDAQHSWHRSEMVTQAEILERLSARFTLTPVAERGSAPAERFLVDGGPQSVGVIASVSAPFCASCDRVRLTADGQLRNCLFARREVDLRGPLRDGASDDELAELVIGEMARKEAGHGISRPGFEQPYQADVGHRRLSAPSLPSRPCPGWRRPRTTSLRNPRSRRNWASCSRWSSQASHTLRRSASWSFGLFHSRAQAALAGTPFALHTSGVARSLPEVPGVVGTRDDRGRPAERPRRRRVGEDDGEEGRTMARAATPSAATPRGRRPARSSRTDGHRDEVALDPLRLLGLERLRGARDRLHRGLGLTAEDAHHPTVGCPHRHPCPGCGG